jgi:O-antigen/teichoic acid export membrane protein
MTGFQIAGTAASVVASTALRIATIGLKALLIVALAVWFNPSELGVYGLVAATISLTTYLFGLDFHTFTLRQLSISDLASARKRVRDQFVLFAFIYIIGGTLLAIVLLGFGVNLGLVAIVVPLAAAQHAALELNRILNRLGRVLAATLCLLVRDAAWVPACFVIKWLSGHLSLEMVLLCWMAGSLFSILFGSWLLGPWSRNANRPPVDFGWLAMGLRTGLKMLVGSISVRALFSVDRMILALLVPLDVVGAYTFFAMACAAAQGLFDTAVLTHYWPHLLEAVRQGDAPARREAQRKLDRACLWGGIAGGAVLAVSITILV